MPATANELEAHVSVISVAVVLVSLVACATDLAARRIPNPLTFGAALAALVFHSIAAGWPGAGSALAGWGLGVALFLPFFLLGGMGAGDVKLLGALGAWLGPGLVVWVALYGAIAGGVLAVLVALASGYGPQLAQNLRLILTHWRVAGIRRLDSMTLENGAGPRLAYAVPIAVGAVCALVLR